MQHAELMELTSPQRFREGDGPPWHPYVDALKVLDGEWQLRRIGNTSFGVFGPQPSWEDTIARAAPLFELDSWAELDDEQQSMVAPAHSFANGDALLGSVGRRSPDVRAFLLESKSANDRDHILSLLKHARTISARSVPLIGGDILAEMCDVRGMGRSFATRLLALARPDAFVVVNHKSVDWLRHATGLSLAGKRRTYRLLLKWLAGQDWYREPEPNEPLAMRLWHIRAALIDAFAYQPWQ